MKLVASSASSKLPAAEICALEDDDDDNDDDDDDDDKVKVRKGARFFSKLRMPSTSNDSIKVRSTACFAGVTVRTFDLRSKVCGFGWVTIKLVGDCLWTGKASRYVKVHLE